MNSAEELKKLKELLDDGIIDEEDFNKKKAEILKTSFGIEKDESEPETDEKKIETIKEIEKRSEELDKKEQELKEKEDLYKDDVLKEKAKITAELEAKEEYKNKKKAETKVAIEKRVTKTKIVLKWILAAILWLLGVTSVCLAFEGLVHIPLGIIMIVQGCMACPKITEITKKYDVYTKNKTVIVWITVILWVVLCTVFSTDTNEVTNEAIEKNSRNSNQIIINDMSIL